MFRVDEDYYVLLGVTITASHDEIKAAYKARIRAANVDQHTVDDQTRAHAETWSKRYNAAKYWLLDDPRRKQIYDIELRAARFTVRRKSGDSATATRDPQSGATHPTRKPRPRPSPQPSGTPRPRATPPRVPMTTSRASTERALGGWCAALAWTLICAAVVHQMTADDAGKYGSGQLMPSTRVVTEFVFLFGLLAGLGVLFIVTLFVAGPFLADLVQRINAKKIHAAGSVRRPRR